LFPGYVFVAIELQWHAARWSPGVAAIIMDGTRPARVPDNVIDGIRDRERGGFVVLPPPPKPAQDHLPFNPGDPVRIRSSAGAMAGLLGICQGMRGTERVEVLLALLGRVTLPRADVERG